MARSKKRFRQPHMINVFRKGPYVIKLGNYKAGSVFLQEACINNVVLRVELSNLHEPKENTNKNNLLLPVADNIRVKNKSRRGEAKRPREEQKSVKPKSQSSSAASAKSSKRIKKLERIPKNAPKEPRKTVRDRKLTKARYYLEFPPVQYVHSKLAVDFNMLSEMICGMKLPSHQWKITVILRGQTTAVFRFCKSTPSTSVTFYKVTPYYKILMDGVPVILLGCPKTVNSVRDMEILLDIVNRLNLQDCMVSKV